jgi:hypothetical protein
MCKREEEYLGTVRFGLVYFRMMIFISILYLLFSCGLGYTLSPIFLKLELASIVTMAACLNGMEAGRDPNGVSVWCCWPCTKKERAILDCLIWSLIC